MTFDGIGLAGATCTLTFIGWVFCDRVLPRWQAWARKPYIDFWIERDDQGNAVIRHMGKEITVKPTHGGTGE